MSNIKLTILVPTVPSRINYFYPRIMNELLTQIKPYNHNIELIAFFDNKKRTIGKKRDEMLSLVQGEYVVFIDDDDRITSDYIHEIMIALQNNPDTHCVVFDTICRVNGGHDVYCKYGIEFEYGNINDHEWRGKPAHTMVYKSSIAKKHHFDNVNNGEDVSWVKRACLDIVHQTRIDKVLYYYDAEYATTSETANLSDETIENNMNLKIQDDKK